jgi:septum formation protein
LGKPADAEEARAFLRRLRGQRHVVITAVAVVRSDDLDVAPGMAWTGVWLRPFSDAELEAYVATGDPLDKAGAYAIQHGAFRPVARLEGSEANVIGLPLALTAGLLARLEAVQAPRRIKG